MLRRIEREERNRALRRIGKISAGVIAGVLAVAAGPRVLEWFTGSSSASSVQSGACPPGDLACLDERYYEEYGFPFSHGEPDGCGLDSIEEQLRSPLCCPHVAADPMTCPPLNGTVDTGPGSSDPTDGESPLPGGMETPEEITPEETPAPPPSVPRRTPADIFEKGEVAPG